MGLKKKTAQTLEQNLSFEDALSQLELLIADMERGSLTLEDALAKYAEGLNLSRVCLGKLNNVESAINKIVQETNGQWVENPLLLTEENT